ncbi:MAG: hypothetical protein HKN36_02570 [Hellea sp.]|nr:hypothetical protein [Hellea sp.]
MKKLLLTTIAAIAATGSSALALDIENPVEAGLNDVQLFETAATQDYLPTFVPVFSKDSRIVVARLDGGRLIPTPTDELVDWNFLDRRIDAEILNLSAFNYIDYVPEIPMDSEDTDNKIDEVRLTAAGEGFDYVLIYGVGPDASWASFGKRTLSETGLTVSKDCKSWEGAKAKALLVESRTGIVLGAVTADNIEYNIGQLADRVGEMITDLSSPVA